MAVARDAGDPVVDSVPDGDDPVVDSVPDVGDPVGDSDPEVGDCVCNNKRSGIIFLASFGLSIYSINCSATFSRK